MERNLSRRIVFEKPTMFFNELFADYIKLSFFLPKNLNKLKEINSKFTNNFVYAIKRKSHLMSITVRIFILQRKFQSSNELMAIVSTQQGQRSIPAKNLDNSKCKMYIKLSSGRLNR